jgi:hypothetical protein
MASALNPSPKMASALRPSPKMASAYKMMHARAHIGQHVEGIAQSLGLDTGPELHFDSDTQAVHIYVDSATCTVVPSLLVNIIRGFEGDFSTNK